MIEKQIGLTFHSRHFKLHKKMRMTSNLFLAIIIFVSACSTAKKNKGDQLKPYSPVSKELYDTLAYFDNGLFDAFNSCNLEKFKEFFTEDLEFFHDKGGLTNYTQTRESLKNSCNQKWKVRRELVEGSLEVYPIKDYGAIQIGSHRFYNTEKGPEELGGTFKFVHIWQKKNGKWKISRVVSYDH